MPNCNSQRRNSPDIRIHQQRAGAEQGSMGCMLRVRTRPECPEENLRELTWDSNPNCRIARERTKGKKKKKTERENFPAKSSKALPGLLTEQRIEQSQEESFSSGLAHPLPGGREAGGLQPELEGERQSWPQRQHPTPNCEEAPSC